MNVLFFSPGFPAEMPYFTRGLAEAGARVVGIGDQPRTQLPEEANAHLADYVRVPSLWSEEKLTEAVRRLDRQHTLDRIECLWEPGMTLAARLREVFDLPGLGERATVPFRDKGRMKEVLDAAGLRTPRHFRATTESRCRQAAELLGYPLIVKPIAGAGSADTHRLDGESDLERVLPDLRHVGEVSVEEFIDGEEYTYDTICRDGKVLYENLSWYRPRPLIGRSIESLSPQTVALRYGSQLPELAAGRELGKRVLAALGFDTGFTHMEWFLKSDGEAVFGEIGARPPGARSVDIMNYAGDTDLFRGWGEAVVQGEMSQPTLKPYNAAVVFKRAEGSGRIDRIEGLGRLLERYGPHVAAVDLLPLGTQRRNWKQTLLSDGSVIVRHPDLTTTLEIADRFGSELRLYAS